VPKVSIKITGASQAAKSFDTVSRRLSEPMTPLLTDLGSLLRRGFQENLQSEGRRSDTPWPEPHEGTVAIRKFYGHTGPRLTRGGNLLASIGVLDRGRRHVSVGSAEPFAFLVHEGGTVTDELGHDREVQAHPFLIASKGDLDEIETKVGDYFFSQV